jgi:HK97 gp10 family phage protein
MKFTGATLKGLNLSDVQQDVNRFYVDVGIDSSQEYNAWHAVFVEYGTPTFAADPGIRPAFESNKARVRKIQRDVLKSKVEPID